MDDFDSDDSDSEWYVKVVSVYTWSVRTSIKKRRRNRLTPVDPRLSCNMKKKLVGTRNVRVRRKIEIREDFDTRKLNHIDLVEHECGW